MRCVNRHTIILVWKLLRSYPKLKVYIAPREISRFFVLQVTEIGITVNPICPFFCQVSHHLPILHVGWSFCWKFRSIYSNKYLESRSPGVNSANVFALLKWLKTQCRLSPSKYWLKYLLLGVTVISCPKLINSLAQLLAFNFVVTRASIGNDIEQNYVPWPIIWLS